MVVFLNKVDMLDDEELLELVELEVRELLRPMSFRATRFRSSGAVRWRRWRVPAPDPADPAYGPILELMPAVDAYIRRRSGRWTSRSDADRGRLRHQGPGHGGDGRVERGIVKPGEEIEIVGMGERRKVVVTGVEMFQKTLDEGRPGTTGVPAAGGGARRGPARAGVRQPGWIHPHTKPRPRSTCWARRGGRHTPSSRGTGLSSTSAPRM